LSHIGEVPPDPRRFGKEFQASRNCDFYDTKVRPQGLQCLTRSMSRVGQHCHHWQCAHNARSTLPWMTPLEHQQKTYHVRGHTLDSPLAPCTVSQPLSLGLVNRTFRIETQSWSLYLSTPRCVPSVRKPTTVPGAASTSPLPVDDNFRPLILLLPTSIDWKGHTVTSPRFKHVFSCRLKLHNAL
jgi:hypothetical protein